MATMRSLKLKMTNFKSGESVPNKIIQKINLQGCNSNKSTNQKQQFPKFIT